ncbi:MAG: hypothetical protein ACLFRY_03940 [Spirochaetia bacterium]
MRKGILSEEMEITALPDIISKLLTTKSCTREEFRRIYLYLCKNTHPDLTGKDGEDFIRLKEIYRRIEEKEPSAESVTPFEPMRILQESGFEAGGDPRAALFISLYRYMSTGMHSYRIRRKPPLKERNALILRTVLYWAGTYDRNFLQIFIDYNTRIFQQIRSTSELKQEGKAKRYFREGFDWFFRYQLSGKPASKTLAEDKLRMCLYTLRIFGANDSPVVPFARWLLEELERGAAIIGRKE